MATNTDGTSTCPAAALCGLRRTSRVSFRALIACKLCAGTVVLAFALLPGHVGATQTIAYLQPAGARVSPPQHAPAPPRHALAPPATQAQAEAAAGHHRADFGAERASREARQIANWIVDSADNQGLPFVIIDKIDARIFVFDAGGRIRGAAPALLGSARGDHTVPGIGDREYADMTPETRTTPAGRFVAELGQDIRGEDILWVDYDAAVAIHRVITTKPEERRLERLASATPQDNRISYGCINVPARFYENVVSPAFTGTAGIVYVLPEIRPARVVFGSYNVEQRLGRTVAARTGASR